MTTPERTPEERFEQRMQEARAQTHFERTTRELHRLNDEYWRSHA